MGRHSEAPVSLRDHVLALFAEKDLRDQQRFDAQEKAVQAALLAQQTAVGAALLAQEKATQAAQQSADRATSKAEAASEKRFEATNEFRGQLADQAATFMPRSEAESRLAALAEKVDDLKTGASAGQNRSAGANAAWGYLVVGVGLVVALITIFVKVH
jgi:hypothetical protein